MIRINLLPKELQDKGKGQDWLIVAYASLALMMLSASGVYLVNLNGYKKDLTRKEKWSSQLSVIKSKVAQVEQLDGQKAFLNAKKNTVLQLFQGRLMYPKFLQAFYETLPSEIWIKDISLTEDPNTKNITIIALSGAISTDAIADWLQTLESKPERFSNVMLSSIEARTSTVGQNKQTTYDFSMTFTYVPPAEQFGV